MSSDTAPTNVSVEEKVRHTIAWYRVPLMIALGAALVALMHDSRAFWIGAPVALFGELIQTWAASQLHKNEIFTVSGPYSHVRNPMYIGRFFVGLGLFIMTWNPYLVGIFVLAFAGYAHTRVLREERRLQQIFAPHYQHYCGEVRRWLPRLRPYSKSESRNASWRQACVNHEQLNLFGLIALLVLVYFRIDRLPNWPGF